jgi:hypothetical protein
VYFHLPPWPEFFVSHEPLHVVKVTASVAAKFFFAILSFRRAFSEVLVNAIVLPRPQNTHFGPAMSIEFETRLELADVRKLEFFSW